MTHIIGLTGGIGSGKSSASRFFSDLGIEIVDADVVAREVVEPGSPALMAIEEKFGPSILQQNNHLDRKRLRELTFSNQANKSWLNQLLHPLIRERILSQLKACKGPYALLEAPLLLENNLQQYTDAVIVVDLPEQAQLQRACERDNSQAKQIRAIMNAQISRPERLTRAQFVLDNSSDLSWLKSQVNKIHHQLLVKVANKTLQQR
ncbi:dephospho-CoA kinase [Motilimonas pumila]|uniref:Dephospho-CoA kinase n=1 Tax=Motilimonas pumila TaxID=2303987 RepID=A0A418YI75_9GAMM|nr:dephospho-CoA kinase [Motilimonas pumila]RJG50047.1 dephospho-CoA kinase [Motilimonas pumila]